MTEKDRDHEQEDGSEIKITDRRLFNYKGELRQSIDEQDAAEEPASEPSPPEAAGDPGQFEHRPVQEPAGVDFTMLINAMVQPALLFLGEMAHPDTGEARIDLEQARIQIDLLELLTVKCRGNLSNDEQGLLDRMLYQLRMLYVARSNQPSP